MRKNYPRRATTALEYDSNGQTASPTLAYQYRPPTWRKGLYYLQRAVVQPVLRRAVVLALRTWIGNATSTRGRSSPALQELTEQGIVRINDILSDSQCAEIVQYLSDKPVYDRCASAGQASVAAQRKDMSFGIHLSEHVLDCPHIMELVASPEVVQLAGAYLGCTPTLSTLGVQWSFPTSTPGIAQEFHRDAEDWKYLRFLIYLSDVVEDCGPHVYVKGTHRDPLPLRMRRYRADEVAQQYGMDRVLKVYGKRGTGIAADTCGIHKGELPTAMPRLILTFTFSILPNPLSQYEPIRTRHRDDLKNHTTRLFLR